MAKKFKGAKNSPNDNYGTLQGGGSGLCLADNLTVANCYDQSIVNHMFGQVACLPVALDQTFRAALRRDGVDDVGLCTQDQQAINFPEPPLTYCMDVVLPNR